ncbi:hypothetical protein ACM720_07770 [Neisseria sp. LNP16475]
MPAENRNPPTVTLSDGLLEYVRERRSSEKPAATSAVIPAPA